MCGFVGYINHGNKELLDRSTNLIAHRGPDNQTIFWESEKRTGFGHRRLSIIDLNEAANQPFWSEDKEFLIVFNGEIFNYLELKQELYAKGISFRTNSDTEVLLKGFIEYGTSIVQKLNGMFSFVIYNTKTNYAFAARDHVGIKPFYYTHLNESLIVASEIKSITASLDTIKPDYEALATPIHFQTAPNTGFQNIRKLLPGHYLEFSNGKLNIQEYWNIQIKEDHNTTFDNKKQELDFLLNDSVKRQMLSDVPVGVLLSGGIDSSLIAALMRKHSSQKINSFTIKMAENDLKQQGIDDDSFFAKQVANDFNLEHKEIFIEPKIIDLLPKMVYHLEELIVDPAAINTYLISKTAKESGIDVLLSGIGADEIFGGYRIHRAMNSLKNMGLIVNNPVVKSINQLVKHFPENAPGISSKHIRWFKKVSFILSLKEEQRHLFAKDAALTPEIHNEAFQKNYEFENLNHPHREIELFKKSGGSYLNKLCLSDASIYLPDHNLNYLDKSMMAASIEGRPPLIDYRIVEFAFRCTDSDKIYKGDQKYILKEVARKYLKANIIERPKAPFAAPLRSWIKNDLKEMVFDLLTKKNIEKRGLFNYSFVERVLKDHYEGKTDHSQMILRFLMTEIWFSTFFENK